MARLSPGNPYKVEWRSQFLQSTFACPALMMTDAHLEWKTANIKTIGIVAAMAKIQDVNQRNLIKAGAPMYC